MAAKESKQSFQARIDEFKAWISGRNLIIPILVGCLLYSICICTIGEDFCYRAEFILFPFIVIWEWIHGFRKQYPAIIPPEVQNVITPELSLISKIKLFVVGRLVEPEKNALIFVSLLVLGVLLYHFGKWVKEICCRKIAEIALSFWKMGQGNLLQKNPKTILQINSDGKWEYAPSPKRIEAMKCD